jgi:hypothetical protein
LAFLTRFNLCVVRHINFSKTTFSCKPFLSEAHW